MTTYKSKIICCLVLYFINGGIYHRLLKNFILFGALLKLKAHYNDRCSVTTMVKPRTAKIFQNTSLVVAFEVNLKNVHKTKKQQQNQYNNRLIKWFFNKFYHYLNGRP